MILSETPRRQLIARLVSWGHWFSLHNIVIAIVIAGIYLFGSNLPTTPFGVMYLFSNWFSHISFLTFIGFVILILPLCYLVPNSKFIRAYSSFVAAIGLALLAFDALLYTRHGLHISINSADLIQQQTNSVIADFGWQQWSFLAVLFVVWFLFQLALANALWKRIERFQKLKVGAPITGSLVFLFIFSHLAHIWADAKLYEPILKQDNLFPISYPATAKTLLSKYGFMDLSTYKTKKQLRFQLDVNEFTYPRESFYCAANPTQKWLLLFTDKDTTLTTQLASRGITNHFDMSSNTDAAVTNILFGLPEIFHSFVSEKTPLLLDIPTKLGVPVHLYDELSSNADSSADTWRDFSSQLSTQNKGLFVAFVKESKIAVLLNSLTSADYFFATQLNSGNPVTTITNFEIADGIAVSSHNDIATTTLNAMGCSVPDASHSTGQNLLKMPRNWVVSAQDDQIVVLHGNTRTIIDSNGNYQLYDITGESINNDDLNIALLGQAIKLLSSFSHGK